MDKQPKILNAGEKQTVLYCIPIWLRDLQIAENTARVKERVKPYPEGQTRTEPIAIVCFGPSLNETWEKVKDFKYVMTCSGSHKFMVEHDIIPTWHVDVDPRPHKAKLIGTPQKDTEYMILSCCHRDVLDLLEGYNVKLWHAFETSEEAQRILPAGEWALSGGCSAGLRCLNVARFLGFTDFHIFGMDGSFRDGLKHASEHPNDPPGYALTEYPIGSGVMWKTTTGFLEAARGTFHELDQLPDVRATFYGDGLVQAMAKDYQPKNRGSKAILAAMKHELISAEMRSLNAQLHRENLLYGTSGNKHADTVIKLRESIKAESVLDYGAGKGLLAKSLPFPIWEYDPAIPGKEESPKPADLVICTDVLEHIEPDKLAFVLDDLRRCVKKVGYFVIHMGPAIKKLPDGRNTHLIQQGRSWWEKKLSKVFRIGKTFENGSELRIVVGPIAKAKKPILETLKA